MLDVRRPGELIALRDCLKKGQLVGRAQHLYDSRVGGALAVWKASGRCHNLLLCMRRQGRAWALRPARNADC